MNKSPKLYQVSMRKLALKKVGSEDVRPKVRKVEPKMSQNGFQQAQNEAKTNMGNHQQIVKVL